MATQWKQLLKAEKKAEVDNIRTGSNRTMQMQECSYQRKSY